MASARFALDFAAAALSVPFRRLAKGPLRPSWPAMLEIGIAAMRSASLRVGRRSPAVQRRFWASMDPLPAPVMKRVRFEATQIAGRPATWARPSSGEAGAAVVLYLHGGSYLYGSPHTHREVIARLTLETGARTLALDYRLAPEHPFPAALEDVVAAVRALYAQGVTPGQLFVGGDSAGGGLTVAAFVELRRVGVPMPAGGILLCPWVDLSARGGSLDTNAAFDWSAPWMFERWAEAYLAGADAKDPRASPIFADLAGLPPLLVEVGGAEMLHDQAVAFAARARDSAVETELHVHADLVHNGFLFATLFAPWAAPLEEAGAFVRRLTRQASPKTTSFNAESR